MTSRVSFGRRWTGLDGKYGFKPSKRQNQRLPLDRQPLWLPSLLTSIARVLSSISAARRIRCTSIGRTRGLLLWALLRIWSGGSSGWVHLSPNRIMLQWRFIFLFLLPVLLFQSCHAVFKIGSPDEAVLRIAELC